MILAEFMVLVDSGVKDFKFHPNLPLVSRTWLLNKINFKLVNIIPNQNITPVKTNILA